MGLRKQQQQHNTLPSQQRDVNTVPTASLQKRLFLRHRDRCCDAHKLEERRSPPLLLLLR